jgi:hypothetical protein
VLQCSVCRGRCDWALALDNDGGVVYLCPQCLLRELLTSVVRRLAGSWR